MQSNKNKRSIRSSFNEDINELLAEYKEGEEEVSNTFQNGNYPKGTRQFTREGLVEEEEENIDED